MAEHPVLFEAVIFDLDGTLAATELFWTAAATAGAVRGFRELGLTRPLPSVDEWLSMVGLPLERGFQLVFHDLDEEQRLHLMVRCVEEERAALADGRAELNPGAAEALRTLRELGLSIGIASNCDAHYLETMLDALRLRDHVHQARCLDTPGIRDKAGMIADLLRTFGTRSAVMVGDRAGDAEAAHANAIPHVHLRSGLAPGHERVEAEAEIADLSQLVPCLRGRARAIESALERIGAFGRRERALTIGVTGPSAAGKSLYARDAARLLRERGEQASHVPLDAFLRPRASRQALAAGPDEDHLGRAFDLEALAKAVLEPRSRGEPTAAGAWGASVPRESTLFLEGLFLLDPRIRKHLDRRIVLVVDEATSLARVAARDATPDAVQRVRRDFLPAQRAFEQRYGATSADLVIDARNPLGS